MIAREVDRGQAGEESGDLAGTPGSDAATVRYYGDFDRGMCRNLNTNVPYTQTCFLMRSLNALYREIHEPRPPDQISRLTHPTSYRQRYVRVHIARLPLRFNHLSFLVTPCPFPPAPQNLIHPPVSPDLSNVVGDDLGRQRLSARLCRWSSYRDEEGTLSEHEATASFL